MRKALVLAVLIMGGWVAETSAVDSPPAAAAAPTLELEGLEARLVQTITNGQAGVERLDGFAPLLLHGRFLYVCCNQGILCFRRDLQSGRLALTGRVADVPQRLEDAFPASRTWRGVDGRGCVGAFAGDRLYVVSRAGAALAWYDIDADTGIPLERGLVECPPCTHLVVSPDQRHLYARAVAGVDGLPQAVVWFRLDEAGRPVRAGQAGGRGLASDIWHVSRLLVAPDAKSIYFLSVVDNAIAWIDRDPTGAITYRGAVDMEPAVSVRESTNYFPALSITPDGTWLHAGGVGYGAAGSYGIFSRDPQTGRLSHRRTVRVEKGVDPIPAVMYWKPIYLPDGAGGLLGGLDALMTFRLDRETGRLTRLQTFPGLSGLELAVDLEHGLVYQCHCTDGHVPSSGVLSVVRVGHGLAPGPAPPVGDPPAVPAVGVEHLQTLRGDDLRDKITRPLFNPVSAVLHGGHLYASGEDGILHFRQEDEAGRLSLAGQVGSKKSFHSNQRMVCAGGRLYGARWSRTGTDGLSWYDIDPRTGAPVQREAPACPGASQIVASPDHADLYVTVRTPEQAGRLLWFHLEEDGRPVAAGELAGPGLGWTGHSEWPGLLQAAPDGRHLYAISAEDHAIACIERAPNGSISLKSSLGLEPLAPRDPGGYRYQWASLAVAPDGRRVYAALWNGRPTENRLGVYRRDAATGALSLEASADGERDALANQRGWSLAFAADGTPRFFGSQAGAVLEVRHRPAAGLPQAAVIPETRLDDVRLVLLDGSRGCLYGLSFDAIYVFRVR